MEAFNLNKRDFRSLDNTNLSVYSKVFTTFDHAIIKECQFYCGHLPLEGLLDCRKVKFYYGLNDTSNALLNCLFIKRDNREFNLLLEKCKVTNYATFAHGRRVVYCNY